MAASTELWGKGARGALTVRLRSSDAIEVKRCQKWVRHSVAAPAPAIGSLYNAAWFADDGVPRDRLVMSCAGQTATAAIASQGKVRVSACTR